MRTIPKGIKNHPGVQDVCLDDDVPDDYSGYRADVILKEDWHFAGLDSDAEYWNVYEKRRCGFFLTLKAFIEARPTQYTEAEMKVK